MLFQPFNKSTRPETPGYLDAEIAKGKFESVAKQQENALRSQNMMGAAELYNAGMGDKSPIADSMFGVEEVAPSVAEAGAADAALAGATEVGAGTAIAGGVPGATTAVAGPASAAGLTAAAPAAVGATGAAGAGAGATGALAAMGPAGWAAMAALALGILG